MSEDVAAPLHILVVDDDDLDRMAVRRALRGGRPEVLLSEATEAREALKRLSTERFDCVLLDLQLPGMSGLEVLRQVRAAGVHTPVVMLTGHGDEQTAVELMKAGASDYIPKAALDPVRLRQSLSHAARLGQAEAQARAAQEALRQSEERFRTLAQHSAHIIWVSEPDGGRYEAPNWESFTGQSQAEMQHNGWLRMVHPEDAAAMSEAWRVALERREPLFAEFRLRSRQGGWRWMLCRGVPLRNPDGSVREWVGSLTDITERRLREQEALQRAEFEEQLMAIVSHDLRGPLAAIGLSAASLQATAQLTNSERRALGRILSSNGRANQLIETLLDFTRARLGGGIPVVRQPGELHQAARNAVDEALAAHPSRQVLLHCEGDGHGQWDLDRLEQVLGNLIGNALRYGDPAQPIRVECRGERDEVLLRVHNQGNPISAELLPTLFQPYRVGSREVAAAKGGLGLGLYIVKEIVRAHHGRVEVRSNAEEGTTFTVHLPRQESGSSEPPAPR